ncbi:phosphatase PAP2 family protein [Nocardia sp. NBC_00565]|uniref:phosphatase PAP2 family protein n=1 Tax=Nocardia sp. NBC_00565 TaxID=2975993 RepID=UPI002E81A38C|nr:phosphatase PAP2 family protein [Nocardia sp. NBC_00565]WUC00612.1 phosphatase PAP2 family protein [Nocardia sp. NBC_00565]
MVAVGLGGPNVDFSPAFGGVAERMRAAVHGRGGEAVRQLALITVLYLGYRVGRMFTADDTVHALANARAMLSFEDRLGLPEETTLQGVFLHRDFLAVPANFYYATAHFTVAVGVLLWLWMFRPQHYRWTRNLMVALTGAALAVHVLMPLAPPRMLPEYGFVDLAAVHGQSVYGAPDSGGLSNQFAAMPSLHVGWALLLAFAVVAATRGAWRWLALAHPVLTTLVVVGTGNHYWLDAIIAVVLLGLAALLHPLVVPASATAWGAMGPVGPQPLPTH